jgi:hypothetical protein
MRKRVGALTIAVAFFLAAAEARADVTVATGMFHNASHAPGHKVSGKVSVVRTANGYELRLADDFRSDYGPDIKLILSGAGDANDDKTVASNPYVVVAPRKSLNGAQSYPIPVPFDPTVHRSVVVWCQQFGVQFGTAPLAANPR